MLNESDFAAGIFIGDMEGIEGDMKKEIAGEDQMISERDYEAIKKNCS